MKLRTRLSFFFLGALAVVLVGFSASLYLLASKYLHRQAEERLEAALNTLVAAAEVDASGVEWEPSERKLSFGRRTVEGRFFWRVYDPQGRQLDGSSSEDVGRLPTGPRSTATPPVKPASLSTPDGEWWRVLRRRLDRPRTGGRDHDEPKPVVAGKHEALVIEAGVSLLGIQATLRHLALALGGLSVGLWTLALAGGRRLIRRALRPVTGMAEAAHAIGEDPRGRLPIPPTGDELEDLARSFNALLDRLQDAFERQRRFTGDASHQLRTPLTAIQGQVDLALRQDRDLGEYKRVLGLVQKRTKHLHQIVEALLFLARTDAEALHPDLIPMDLSEWLSEHLRSRPDDPRASDIEWESESGGPHVIRAHPALLGELVDNLLDNASKYSPSGTPIVLRVGSDQDGVILSVEDRGMGIPERDVPHLFEPFYRGEEARQRGLAGLGLGLSVACRLAGLFGARLGVKSRLGCGSTFTVQFPAVDRGLAAAEERHSPAMPARVGQRS